ncbi:hypothetical protein [Anatilimnocola floriformis]|uniref:hypothetical protein n=1 Tax=Anatilimnocola floriformis TaxID=2948575 RepID=UPI0020C40F20|nr:hypothetical protein [Anatilimnocola floriformis]
MFIPIPVVVRHVVRVKGEMLKLITCEHCQTEFGFVVQLEASGEEHDIIMADAGGAKRATKRAEQNLLKKGNNEVHPIPCPQCGAYQEDMVKLLKEEGTSNAPMIAGLIVAVISLIPLAWQMPGAWKLTAAGLVIGLGMMGYSDFAAALYNPNAGDPERRKATGRKHTVWGPELAELLNAGSVTTEPIMKIDESDPDDE